MVDRAAGGNKVSEVAAAAAAAAATAAGADDWRVVDRTLRGLARRRAALDVEEAAWLRRARALGVHRELGFASFFEYVERVLGYAPGPARERLRVADALAALPKLRAAMSAGDVAYSAARELTRVATVDTEDAWLAAAAKHTVREIEDMVSGRRRGDSPDDPPDPAARLHELRLLLPAAVLGKFTAARRALEAACGHPLTDGDLLATLCDGQLAGAAGSHVRDTAAGSHAGDAAAASKPMYQIAITRCPDCTRAWHDVAGHTIEISETELAQASCDADMLGRVDGDKPARVTKTIPPRTRRAVLRRDRGRCVVPGCRNARYVDVHHIVPRVEGGDHTPSKLSALCSAHHKAAHDGRLRIEGTAPDKLRVTHADGRPYGAPQSHVGGGEAVAPPPSGGEVADAPAQAGAAVVAPPATRSRRRAQAPATRRTRGTSKAGGRDPIGVVARRPRRPSGSTSGSA
ncbi:MAG: HNH endonuclease [Myxococcales bacterium]|nr:HNH endonuclease [Myxococcales bacterium]MBK7193825.1 HNH endonuclease [Myxococcales bacterium]